MASLTDRNLIAEIRRETGATNENRVSQPDVEDELDGAKVAISGEVREKLNNGETLAFGEGVVEAALRNYMFLRVTDKVRSENAQGCGPPDHVSVPKSPSRIRRTDFEDSQMNYWRDRMIRTIRDI